MKSQYFLAIPLLILFFGLCSCSSDENFTETSSEQPIETVYYLHSNGSRHNISETRELELSSTIEIKQKSSATEPSEDFDIIAESSCNHSELLETYTFSSQWKGENRLPIIDLINPRLLHENPSKPASLQCDFALKVLQNQQEVAEIKLNGITIESLSPSALESFPIVQSGKFPVLTIKEPQIYKAPFSNGFMYWICENKMQKNPFSSSKIEIKNLPEALFKMPENIFWCRWMIEDQNQKNRVMGAPFLVQPHTPKVEVLEEINLTPGHNFNFYESPIGVVQLINNGFTDAFVKITLPESSHLTTSSIYSSLGLTSSYRKQLPNIPLLWDMGATQFIKQKGSEVILKMSPGNIVTLRAQAQGDLRCKLSFPTQQINCGSQQKLFRGLFHQIINAPKIEVSRFNTVDSDEWFPASERLPFKNIDGSNIFYWRKSLPHHARCGQGAVSKVNGDMPATWQWSDQIRWSGCSVN